MSDALRAVLESGVGTAYPGAVMAVGVDDHLELELAVGGLDVDGPAVTGATVYDLASLTKPIAVATPLFAALSEDRLRLDERVDADLGLSRAVTLRQLLGHASGLPAWFDLRSWLAEAHPGLVAAEVPAVVRAKLRQLPFERAPGTAAVYSDPGYLLLGELLPRRLGRALDDLSATGSPGLTYTPGTAAPTAEPDSPWPPRRGEVHDPSARLLGGVAGNAGVFGTAADVVRWAQRLLRAWRGLEPTIDPAVLRACWCDPPPWNEPTTWRLGFDTPSAHGSTAGHHMGPNAVGHLGFTGTSVWLAPERGLVVVLLSNRTRLGATAQAPLRALRPRVHDAVIALLR